MPTGVGFWSTGPSSNSGQSIGNSTLPPEGPRAVPYTLDFSLTAGYTINVSDLLSSGPGKPGLSAIQGFYADNSASTTSLVITASTTQQKISVPASSQGYVPILSPTSGTITVQSAGGVVVYLDIYNVPLPAILWNAAATFSFVSGGTANGALKTADMNIAPLINARNISLTNAIDVNLVYRAPTTLLYDGLVTAAGNTVLTAALNAFAPIHGIAVTPTPNIVQAAAGLNSISIQINGDNLASVDFWVPAAVPATPTNQPATVFTFPTPLSNPAAAGNTIDANMTTALTTGGVRVIIYGNNS